MVNVINKIYRAIRERIGILVRFFRYLKLQVGYKKCVDNVKTKPSIRVVFFALFDSVWKCDEVYRKMLGNTLFDPIILICPVCNYGFENMVERIEECASFFDRKGYRYLRAYDKNTNRYVDVRKEINPDIIFYTNPYRGLIDDRYFIDKFPDVLTIYLPYAFCNGNCYRENFDLELMNSVWKFYVETPMHASYAKKYGHVLGMNVVVSGQPCIESFITKYSPSDPWKIKDRKWKRIIWAPHHTLEPVFGLDFSCFLLYSDFMRDLCLSNSDKIQICFKPHPLLRNKLNNLWGVEMTDEYYSWWNQQPNAMVSEGDYKDLFLTSDAMIHDSGSFVTEYLFVNKPVLRTMSKTNIREMFNDFGIQCLENHYFAYDESEIRQFVIDVINEEDPMQGTRENFINKVLMPLKILPSDIIVNDIINSVYR